MNLNEGLIPVFFTIAGAVLLTSVVTREAAILRHVLLVAIEATWEFTGMRNIGWQSFSPTDVEHNR